MLLVVLVELRAIKAERSWQRCLGDMLEDMHIAMHHITTDRAQQRTSTSASDALIYSSSSSSSALGLVCAYQTLSFIIYHIKNQD